MEVRLQTYVTEVKRIEELLTMRDKERSELLQQYKSLSVEIDESESYGRRMESRVRYFFPRTKIEQIGEVNASAGSIAADAAGRAERRVRRLAAASL